MRGGGLLRALLCLLALLWIPGLSVRGDAPALFPEMADGEYSIAADALGGRDAVASPALLTLRDGRASVRLQWTSPYYDYMVLGGITYPNLAENGSSAEFEVPVTALDTGVAAVAATSELGQVVELPYTLIFYADSVGPKSRLPQEAALRVLYIAGAIIVVGGMLNHFVKKSRK